LNYIKNIIKEYINIFEMYSTSLSAFSECLHVAKVVGTAQCDEYGLPLLHAIVREIQILMFLLGMRCYNGIYLPKFSINELGEICNTDTYTTRFGTHRERQRSKDLNTEARLIFKFVEWFECLRVKRETRVLF
jgi:hypothetical protein